MNRYKRIPKLLNWFLSLALIVTSISVPGFVVNAEDENADTSNVAVVEDDESEAVDYSDAISYNLNYNEDYSKATLTISVDTEDNVSLDFSNNDELSEKMGGESPSYSINHEITTEDGKTYAFDIVKNGTYNFQAIVLAEGEDFDGQTVGSKDISIQVADLVEGETIESEYQAQETGTDGTFSITQSNVQLAYYNWQAGNPPTSTAGVALNKIKQDATSQTISNYVDPSNVSGGTGYVVVFVKPKDNYLFTGLGAYGAGQCFAVNETFNSSDYMNKGSGIGNYPGLQYVTEAAYKAGYKAAFGWMRVYNSTDVNLNFTTTAVQPKMEISVAAPSDTSNVKPGDTLDFTVTVTPESESNSTIGKVTLTKINETDVSYECTDTGYGTYTYTVPYTITQADFEAGKVTLSASGTVKYNCSFGMTSGKVNSEALIAETASADASPGPNFAKKATATHQFASSTSGKKLPYEVTKLCPSNKTIPVGFAYTPEAPTTTKVTVTGGYWTFEGWDSTLVTPNTENETVTVTGKWKFVDTTLSLTAPEDVVYNGASQQQEPVVKDASGNVLINGTDYTLTYSEDTTNVGQVTVTVTGLNDYGKATTNYQITKRPITFVGNSDSKTYNGQEQSVEGYTISKAEGQYGLVEGHTATLTASASGTGVGTYPGTITAAADVKIETTDGVDVTANYAITTTPGTLKITEKSIGGDTEDITVKDFSDVTYNGKAQKQDPVVTDGTTTLVKDQDYTVSYKSSSTDGDDYTNAGNTITVTITGKGNYSGTVEKTYSITKAPLTVTTESASKVYDGDPLTADGKLDGLVNGETATFTVTGSQTEVGESDSTYALVFDKTADKNNYEVKTESIGKLTVTKSTQDIVITTSDVTCTYDGQAHESKVTVSGLPKGYKAEYTADKKVTDVTDKDGVKSQITNVKILNTKGDDVTKDYTVTKVEGTIKITPATLTVKTDSATKVYDGSKLTADGSIKGFVNGEEASFTVTGNQTDVGSSKNTYTIDWEHGTAKESNYIIQEEKGSLTVEAQHLTPETDSEDPTKEDPNYKGITIDSPDDVVYDGDDQKFVPEVTTKDGTKLTPGIDYEVTYTKDGQTTDDFTNSGEIKVTITGKGNYSGTIEKTYSITKRPITFVGNSDSETYNGQEQTVEGYTVSKAEGQYELVEGHTAILTASASGTNVGTYKGNITAATNVKIETTDGVDVTANYAITTTPGTLKITEKSIGGDTEDITVKDFSDVTYNGKAQKQDPVVTDGTTTLVKDQDYTVSYKSSSTDGDDYTNAGNTITVTITGKGNYSGTIEKTYTIKKAHITLKMNSATKVYDGNALTAGGSLEGFVGDESASLTVTGSQTNVGESDNTYNLDWNGTAKADNYTVTVEKGTLTVEAQHLTPEVNPEDSTKEDPNYSGVATNDPENVVYDGKEHKFVPEVTTKDGTKLTPGVDYDVIYSTDDFINPGEIKVIIIGKGNYSGTIEKTYKIVEKEKSNPQPSDTETKSNNSTDNKTTTASNSTSQTTSASVTTGDTSNLIFWISLLALAVVAAVATLSLRRKR